MTKSEMTLLVIGGLLMPVGCRFAYAAQCDSVSGTIATNFVDPSTTVGTVTGDLRGGVSASLLSVTPGADQIVFKVTHRFVTEAGDTLLSSPSEAIGKPTRQENVFGVTFDRMELKGLTGSYEGATVVIRLFGAADLSTGETLFRYRGRVCFDSGKP